MDPTERQGSPADSGEKPADPNGSTTPPRTEGQPATAAEAQGPLLQESTRPMSSGTRRGSSPAGPVLGPGDRIADFEIVSVLGQGSFAVVYLARQLSLDRQVALKVSAESGSEGRTLANLEHEHIVRVFAESVDPQSSRRLMCMQYVNGTTLQHIGLALARRDPASWSGRAVLEAVDELSWVPATFDPGALRDRELLGQADFVEAVCWLGARVAEALAHAHSLGVLHRDIKPANILVNRYGRPLLADFNIASDPRTQPGSARAAFGGTVAYMAPEHLDALNPDRDTPPEAVDCRSDIYSLGLVLLQLLTGELPLGASRGSMAEKLARLADARRSAPPPLAGRRPVPEMLDGVVRRCLQPGPLDRFQSADQLAKALDACREHRRIENALPPAGPLTRAALRWPFALGTALLFLPHLVGSVVNISYNQLRIVEHLTAAQQAAFQQLVLAYNLIVYPLCLLLMVRLVGPVRRLWKRLDAHDLVGSESIGPLRRRVLQLPLWAVGLSCAGWLPGGLLFPLGLQLLAGPCPAPVFGHFLVSFTVSGLIALTYSVFAVQYVALRVLYPRMWTGSEAIHSLADRELRPLGVRLQLLQLLAGVIPLAGAILMIFVGPEDVASGYEGFRLLVTGLIALGMVGFSVAVSVSNLLNRTAAAFTRGQSSRS